MSIEILIENWPRILSGTLTTLQLLILSMVIACALALPVAIARASSAPSLRWPVTVFISFFRGTPLLGQLFLIYYGSGQFRTALEAVDLWWFFRDPLYCTILTFALNSTAYQAESLKGGLLGVPRGEIEAGLSVGMSRILLYRRIILPSAYRIALPALGNEVILMLKASAIASVVSIFDLMAQTRVIFSHTFEISIYLWAAVIYLLLTGLFVWSWHRFERWLNPQWAGSRSATIHRTGSKPFGWMSR